MRTPFGPCWLAALGLALTAAAGPALLAEPGLPPGGRGGAGGPDEDWTLILDNGDFVHGRVLPGTEEQGLVFGADRFQQPLCFSTAGLDRLELPRPDQVAATPPVRLVLWDGSILYGAVLGGDETQLRIQSERHGTVALARSAVARLDNLDSEGNLLFDGMLGLDQWQVPGGGQPWVAEDGAIVTQSKGAVLYRPLPDCEVFSLDVELSAQDIPVFRIAFGAQPDPEALRLAFSAQAMGRALVLHRQAESSLLYERLPWPTLGDGRLSLRFEFDRGNGTLTVYEGLEARAVLRNPEKLDLLGPGIMVLNGGSDLTLWRLRVSRGGLSDVTDPRTPVVDGSQVQALDGELGLVMRDGTRLERTDYDLIEFPAPESRPAAGGEELQLQYYDGSVLRGDLVGSTESGLLLRKPWSSAPLLAGFEGLKIVSFPARATASDQPLGVIEAEGLRLHGHITGEGAGAEGTVGWRPIHGLADSTLDLNADGRITFPGRAGAVESLDELHLLNGDVLPCRVRAITEDELFLDLEGEPRVVDRSAFKAVRFWSEHCLVDGFEAAEWRKRDGSVHSWVIEGVLHLEDSADLIRPGDLPGVVHVSFDAEWGGDGVLFLGLFEKGSTIPRNGRVVGVTLSLTGGRLRAMESVIAPRAGGNVFIGKVSPARNDARLVELGAALSAHVDVHVDLPERRCVVFANGTQILSARLDRLADLQFGGLFFTRNALNSAQNQVFFANGRRVSNTPDSNSPVDLVNLRVRPWVGYLAEESLDRLLTRRRGTPRASMMDLLRAPNGDVLRGTLVGLQEETAGFKARLDDIAVPRAKVAELVHLADMQPREEGEDTLTVFLFGGGRVTLRPGRCDGEFLRGTAEALGELSVPWGRIASLQLGEGHQRPPSPYEGWVQYDPMTIDLGE